jgi:multicomponent Na+:H+ antiporter subunit B
MKRSADSPIILYGARFLSPFILVFGLYVIFHGHYSPGGGFQGGALLAAGVLLVRIAVGRAASALQFGKAVVAPFAAAGVLVYFVTGLAAMAGGGNFLDYSYLPGPALDSAALRYWGILVIEIGVGMAVMAVLVMLFDNLLAGEDRGDE